MAFFTTSTRNLLQHAAAAGVPHYVAQECDDLIRQGLRARNDSREVVVDPKARYFGAELSERSLVSAGEARLGKCACKIG